MNRNLVLQMFGLIAILFFINPAIARTTRTLWIPQALVPGVLDVDREPSFCRLTMEEMIAPLKKGGDLPGQFYWYSVGGQCEVFQTTNWRFEAGLDWVEASGIQTTSVFDPLQGHAQLTYGGHLDDSFSAAIGVQNFGLKVAQNNFNILYALVQQRAGNWMVAIGPWVGNTEMLKNASGVSEAKGVLFGLWRRGPRGALGLEYLSGQNRFGYIFLGGEALLSENIALALGLGLANDHSAQRDQVLLRITLD